MHSPWSAPSSHKSCTRLIWFSWRLERFSRVSKLNPGIRRRKLSRDGREKRLSPSSLHVLALSAGLINWRGSNRSSCTFQSRARSRLIRQMSLAGGFASYLATKASARLHLTRLTRNSRRTSNVISISVRKLISRRWMYIYFGAHFSVPGDAT